MSINNQPLPLRLNMTSGEKKRTGGHRDRGRSQNERSPKLTGVQNTDALIYYLRHILRDYSDPVSLTILSNIRPALTDPDARVLIAEQLNPDISTSASTNTTGGPLPLYAAFKDFSMLSIGGKERSLPQFAALADAAGLRVSGVWRDEATPHGVVELALK